MEWIDRFNEAIDYVERHLTDEINYVRLGEIACCSSYHFQRMFTYLAGQPMSEYIRKRKMSLAAVDLQGGAMKVVDVAAKYGYDSPTAFNRAFQSVHGVAPSAVRDEGVSIKSFPPMKLTVVVKGAEALNYRIETKPAFRVAGVSVPLARDIEDNFQTVPAKWGEVAMDGTLERLAGMMEPPVMGILGVSVCNDIEPWRYYIAVGTDKKADGFETYTVPAATWAVFAGSGTNVSLQDLERRVVTEWLPTSGYEYGSAPDVEVYLNPDPENAQYELWIPVVKK